MGRVAREKKQERFTSLLHHLNVELLRRRFYARKRKAAPGVDGVRWEDYAEGLEDRLQEKASPSANCAHVAPVSVKSRSTSYA